MDISPNPATVLSRGRREAPLYDSAPMAAFIDPLISVRIAFRIER
jgi:hypothetical protein